MYAFEWPVRMPRQSAQASPSFWLHSVVIFFFFKSTFFAFQSQKLFHVDFFFVAIVVRLPILDLLASAYFYYDFVSLVCAEMDANRELIKIEEVES